MSARQCIHCGSSDTELRPYGPDGADVCFACAMQSPEREAETRRQFALQLNEAAAVALTCGVVVIGADCGPYPTMPGKDGAL